MLDDEGLELSVEYRESLFDEATVARIAERFEVFLTAALEDPDRPVADLPLRTKSETAQLEVADPAAFGLMFQLLQQDSDPFLIDGVWISTGVEHPG